MQQVTTGFEERRQLTTLFCDLVEATELSAGLDPEDYFEIVRAYHARVAEPVAHHGGHVAQFLGDGLLAYFGYPTAYEDAAERAVRAGLAIVESLEELNQRLERDTQVRLAVRVGIHTGAVVLGPTGGEQRREVLAMGEALNLAARLQAVADANTVVMSGDSERLVRGLFVTEDLGQQQLKGFARPIPAFRVLGTSGVRSRLDVLGERLTPFVGREDELRRLLAAWEEVRHARGRAVSIAGEPGIGKSRLARAFRDEVARTPHIWLDAQCSPWTENTAFYPVVELQRRLLGLRSEDPAAETLARLEEALKRAGLAVDEALPTVAALHDLALPAETPPPSTSPEAQRRKTLETLTEWLLRLARTQPVIVLLEDVQWIDPSTAELVGRLAEQLAELPVLLVFTHRRDDMPDCVEPSLEIRLDPLPQTEALRLVEQLVPSDAAARGRTREIVARAEGVPLYLEELTKAVLDPGGADGYFEQAGGHAASVIPATLRDSLRARLDGLGATRDLALLASVIGREFPYALVAAAAQPDERELHEQLDRLVESELVFQAGELPDATYRFKHALIRDEAYQSLVRSARREYHRRVGEALETEFPRETATRPELVAHHFLEAGEGRKAVDYLTLAARRAVVTSANVEALHHADRALAELRHCAPSPSREQLELTLCTLRGAALIATRGYASHEVQRTFARARELVTTVDEGPSLLPVLHGLWLFHMVRGDREATRELAAQLLTIAESSDDAIARLYGFTVAGIQGFFEGRFKPAIEYVERAFALYEPQLHGELAATHSLGTAGVARANAATCLWYLGYPDRARALVRQVVADARETKHAFTLVGALVMGAMVFHLCREPATAHQVEKEALGLATEQGFPLWIGGARCGLGTSMADLGKVDEGIEQVREGLATFRATGAQTNAAFVLSGLATVCLANGRLCEAEQAVDEALALVERNLETFPAAELWRLKGEVTLAHASDERSAEALFERALELAHAEEARSLELRAATSLARLAERRGERARAVEVLAPIYESFGEGLDTPDLKDAEALLAHLRGDDAADFPRP
jgi:class 3 adenylate cyclase/predicted ATPase